VADLDSKESSAQRYRPFKSYLQLQETNKQTNKQTNKHTQTNASVTNARNKEGGKRKVQEGYLPRLDDILQIEQSQELSLVSQL
jgi:hypothetical protein